MNIVSITVNVQGAGDNYDRARDRAIRRLDLANAALQEGNVPADPGVNIDDRDPGGGPCRPEKYTVEVLVNQDVLPEAQSNDDD